MLIIKNKKMLKNKITENKELSIARHSGNAFNLDTAKEQMKNYRDLFGGQFDLKMIDEAKSIFDLESIFIEHSDFLSGMESDAQSSLSNFKRKIGVF